jgi:hypothetical protein
MRLPPSVLAGSPTFDEPVHLVAGRSYLRTREFKVNLQHPPLLEELAAAARGAGLTRGGLAAGAVAQRGRRPCLLCVRRAMINAGGNG